MSTALVAFLCFVAAFVVFLLQLLDKGGGIESAWGFMFISAGLALMVAGGAVAAVRSAGS